MIFYFSIANFFINMYIKIIRGLYLVPASSQKWRTLGVQYSLLSNVIYSQISNLWPNLSMDDGSPLWLHHKIEQKLKEKKTTDTRI
jgi:hypothetical protein